MQTFLFSSKIYYYRVWMVHDKKMDEQTFSMVQAMVFLCLHIFHCPTRSSDVMSHDHHLLYLVAKKHYLLQAPRAKPAKNIIGVKSIAWQVKSIAWHGEP